MGPDRPITQLAVSRKPSSNPKVAPNEKTPGATGPPALSNFSKSNNFQRAGDRTRTGDVQLGKRTKNNAAVAYVVDFPGLLVQSTSVRANESAPNQTPTVTNGNQS